VMGTETLRPLARGDIHMTRSRRRRWPWLDLALLAVVVVLAFATVAVAGGADKEVRTRVSVIIEGARIHAEGQGADLSEVLKALADNAGLRIVWSGSPSGTVTLQWRGITLEDAVGDLLRNKDHLLVYRPTASGGEILAEVWVFGEGGERLTEFGRERVALTEPRPDDDTITAAMRELMQLTAELRQKGDLAQLTRLLRERIHDPDPQIRRFVFSALADAPDQSATEILAKVVRDDPDPRLRRMAASTLRKREGAESVPALATALSEEPDPDVRQAFLKTLGRWGEAAVPALSEAASDPDPTVARAARRMLRRVIDRD